MRAIRPQVSRTDFKNLLERSAEAQTLPVGRETVREIRKVRREIDDLYQQGMAHLLNFKTRRRECPEPICLHVYEGDPRREMRISELGRTIADLLDKARFSYRWQSGEDPGRAMNLASRYSLRRPHVATLIRSLSKQIGESAQGRLAGMV